MPSRKLKLGSLTTSQCEEIVLKKNLKSVVDLEREFPSPAVVKKFLSETSIFFPGVPMRRLYKQYKTKQDEYRIETETRESELPKKEVRMEKERESSVKEIGDVKEEKPAKRGRSKRKISTQSDEELNEKQVKKARRKKDKDKKASEEKKEDIAKGNLSEQTRKKRGREEYEEEAQRPGHAERKSSRRSRGTHEEEQEEQKDTHSESSKRKKRKTMESELEANSVPTTEDVKSEDSRASVDEKKADLLWTEKYQPECSSEIMGNASSVSRLKSWLEAWKIKREKTLRKELELQKK